ncbi:MAG: endolytic transglycosylase MltG [Coriobacteriia bacterium]|nr:endolytic transglycosylase MltG [Coriobacteriia bacterium]MBN2839587.1 endolytic transglycosylase MltG [Coriobacteriia bacterium]
MSELRGDLDAHRTRWDPGARSERGVRPADQSSRRRARAVVVLLVAAVLVLCVPAFGIWRVFFVADSTVVAGQPVQVEIPAGADTAAIAGVLTDAGVIGNAAMFRLRARIEGIDNELRSGIYDLETGMSHDDVVDRLLAGPPVEYTTVTIPEGFTVELIAERLERDASIPAAEFIELALGQASVFEDAHPYLAEVHEGSLEGYLFPKTYRIVEGATASDVIELMLGQFDTEFAAVDLTRAGEYSMHELVTIASMIEREARVGDERPLVSSVIHNRLDRGMRLEVDATIEYVIKKNRPRLLNSDLAVESPFNTYKYAGLPPGPIASPGLASLQAAAAPADTDYLYYVLTSADGSHTFTETYEEFLIAKEKSREVTP